MTAFLQPLHSSPLLYPTLKEPGLLQFSCVGMLPQLLLLLVYSWLHAALLPGNSCWARLLEQRQGTELLALLHLYLFPLAVAFASGRLPAQKRQVGKAKREGTCATSIIASPTPALMMVHVRDDLTRDGAQTDDRNRPFMCIIVIWFGLLSRGRLGRGCGHWAVLSWYFASENETSTDRYRKLKHYCPTRS